MELNNSSAGTNSLDSSLELHKKHPDDKVIALAGNPNVGKSTVFNALTGMNQHTGNWPGKTVASAQGYCSGNQHDYVLVDLPGTYSLMAHSAEEEVARNFICFDSPDSVVVVCDATCLERNLNLVLQTIEICENVIVCVNLMDEAKRKGISLNLDLISSKLGVPVIGTTARDKSTLVNLTNTLDLRTSSETDYSDEYRAIQITYDSETEHAISLVEKALVSTDALNNIISRFNIRWLSLRLLENEPSFIEELSLQTQYDFVNDEIINEALANAWEYFNDIGVDSSKLKDRIVSALVKTAESICSETVTCISDKYDSSDRKLDKILTSKLTGYPVMIILLMLVFWITITGANYPSGLLSNGLFWIQERLTDAFNWMNAPEWLHGILVLGIYRVLAWVVSVMLPPMAIFFPLFTLLEDSGYLPRIAYNLDKPFKRCKACGKQALTMCMGFGCNAAGIIGCRIIDSPRERLLAILTNNFVPCNGRFPTLIAILAMFFVGTTVTGTSSILSAVLLTAVILTGILVTFGTTKLLSMTLLKGVPSSFTLELPPYRKPQILSVILRSITDRTLFVLGRAVVVAAPAGLVIWIMANIFISDVSLLNHCANFLDPFAQLMGLDGVILFAFILGFPANEIVIPIIIMAYTAQGSLVDMESLSDLRQLFVDNGWTWITAVSTMLFSLMHWPCSTTLLTIRKETGSWKWTFLAALIPTAIGIATCMIFANIARLF